VFALALIAWLSLTPSSADAEIIVVCGPPSPDGKECCPFLKQIYWKDYGQPPHPQAPDRADRSKVRAWSTNTAPGPEVRRSPLSLECLAHGHRSTVEIWKISPCSFGKTTEFL
jgi:hypothetical protein